MNAQNSPRHQTTTTEQNKLRRTRVHCDIPEFQRRVAAKMQHGKQL